MVHGGNVKGKAAAMNHVKKKNSIGVVKNVTTKPPVAEKKTKSVSYKNQIRSTERILRKKDLPPEVRQAQEKKLEDIKKKQELLIQLEENRVTIQKNKKPKFFERRKLDRGIKKLERALETASDETRAGIIDQLAKLKEDLEYVKFFPKTEKYVPLFSGGNDPDVVERRNILRQQIKGNIVAAAASGKDLEETEDMEDDFFVKRSSSVPKKKDVEDDFFLNGSSSDEAEAGDEVTERSFRKHASSFKKEVSTAPKRRFPSDSGPIGVVGKKPPRNFGNAASDNYAANKNQKQKSFQAVEPASRPPKSSFSSSYSEPSQKWKSTRAVEPASRPSKSSFRSSNYSEPSQKWKSTEAVKPAFTPSKGTFRSSIYSETSQTRSGFTSSNKAQAERVPAMASINKSQGGRFSSSGKDQEYQNTTRTESSNNVNSNSEAPHKPKRKRRPKKKKT